MIFSEAYKRILIISADRGTRGRNFNEPESASLLGDGAAAVLVEPACESYNSELIYYNMETWPSGSTLTEVRGGGTNKHPQDPGTIPEDNLFSMDGPAIYKIARRHVYKMILKSLKVTKNIKENSKNKPIRKKPSWVFWLNGLPKIFSIP